MELAGLEPATSWARFAKPVQAVSEPGGSQVWAIAVCAREAATRGSDRLRAVAALNLAKLTAQARHLRLVPR